MYFTTVFNWPYSCPIITRHPDPLFTEFFCSFPPINGLKTLSSQQNNLIDSHDATNYTERASNALSFSVNKFYQNLSFIWTFWSSVNTEPLHVSTNCRIILFAYLKEDILGRNKIQHARMFTKCSGVLVDYSHLFQMNPSVWCNNLSYTSWSNNQIVFRACSRCFDEFEMLLSWNSKMRMRRYFNLLTSILLFGLSAKVGEFCWILQKVDFVWRGIIGLFPLIQTFYFFGQYNIWKSNSSIYVYP